MLWFNDESDEFEELSLSPDLEDGKLLEHLYLIKLGLFQLVLKDALKIFFGHHSEMAVFGTLDGRCSKLRLIIFKEGLLPKCFATLKLGEFNKHGHVLRGLANRYKLGLFNSLLPLKQVFELLFLKVEDPL